MKEIDCIKTACSITDKILKKLTKELKRNSFKTEKDIFNYLKQQTKKHNCRLAFKPIIATKENATEIHHKANNTRIKKGFLVIDFGVKYKGYCSDCTRTFYIGKPNKKEIKFYNLVLTAQLTALNNVKPGVYAADIDAIARAALWKYYKNFVHGTGHGVGKKVHQSPSLKPRSRAIIKKGDVLTVEPGLYFKNKLGIRIEDTIQVKDQAIILTKTTKKLINISYTL